LYFTRKIQDTMGSPIKGRVRFFIDHGNELYTADYDFLKSLEIPTDPEFDTICPLIPGVEVILPGTGRGRVRVKEILATYLHIKEQNIPVGGMGVTRAGMNSRTTSTSTS
jgi:hypothetical protein